MAGLSHYLLASHLLVTVLLQSASATRLLQATSHTPACGQRDALCRDAIPTSNWGVVPPLPTCCVAGTTCTFISRYSRCLENYSDCRTAYQLIKNWTKWSGQPSNPFSTTLKVLEKAGLLDRLKTRHSKTFFAPTDAAWKAFAASKGKAAFDRFFTDKEYVEKWLSLVLVPDAVGNGGGARQWAVGRMIVDLNMYRLTGPANAGQLASIISDWKCTETARRDYVFDTDTVYVPCSNATPAPWDPPA